MYKKTLNILLLIVICILYPAGVFGQLYFSDDFESGLSGWTQEYVKGTIDWKTADGGYTTNSGTPGSGHPPYAYEGDANALFHYTSQTQEATILTTPAIDLEFAIKPELLFWHAQDKRYMFGEWNNDELEIYYKKDQAGDWVFLEKYLNVTPEWTYRRIILPDTAISNNFYLGFKATTKNGWGVCIDSFKLLETEILKRFVDTITFHQPDTLFVSSGTDDNPVMRIDVRIEGNNEQALFNSLVVTSLNIDDDDIKDNGVKLYATRDTFFNKDNLLAPGINFSGGDATFNNINYELKTGYTSLWITYDIKEFAQQGNYIDAMIEAGNININSNTFPETDQSPPGKRDIFQTIFSDDFESNNGWTLTGEFEIDRPKGLGGSSGSPDPTYAVSGDSVLGSDLTGLGLRQGDYEDSLTNRAYQAISPEFDCYYYNQMQLGFYQWLNVDIADSVFIDISRDGGITWKKAWGNHGTVTNSEWIWHRLDIYKLADRAKQLKIRFAVGATDASWTFSGWNIDDVYITGNFITNDVGVASRISPVNGTGHGNEEPVSVVVKNYGADPSVDTVILFYHFDDGYGRIFESYDTLYGSIPVEDSVIFTFSEKLDLTVPGVFYNAYIATIVNGDEDYTNDTLVKDLYAMPTIPLPYEEDFENGESFWLVNGFERRNAGGINSSWEMGIPQGAHIYSANSGVNAWVTMLNGPYRLNDSSFVVSPYLDFTGAELPIFQFSMWKDCHYDFDGVTLQYSIDEGSSWQHVNKHVFTWNWNWYNNDNINKFETPGWDSLTSGYITAKQVLPDEVVDNTVLLRFAFASDDSLTTHEGFAFDDIKIYNAPPDVGVLSIDYPVNSCELTTAEEIIISIKNFGVKDIHAGDTIITGVIVEGNKTAMDTVILDDALMVDSTLMHVFTKKFDFYDAGNYHIKAYTSMKDDDNVYSDSSYTNDTTETNILVDRPYVDLGPNLNTVHPDTIMLNAYEETGNTYLWHDGSTDSVYHVSDGGLHIVTVTNSINCFAVDTVNIVRLIADYGVSDIVTPVSDCELGNDLPVTVEIKNYGTDTANQNYSLEVILEFDNGSPITEAFTLPDTLYPDSTVNYTFNATVDMPSETVYKLKCYTRYIDDDTTSNDTTTHNIEYYGYPYFDLQPDDIIHEGMSYTFDATTPDIVSYVWQDSTLGPTYTFNTPGAHTCAVTVTDIHGCPASDTSYLKLIIPDIGVKKLVSPKNHCGPLSDGKITMNVYNFGSDTLKSGTTIKAGCKVNTIPQTNLSAQYTTTKNLSPGDSILYTFAQTVNLNFTGSFKFTNYVVCDTDSIPENDTLISTVTIFEIPTVSLGKDTILDTFRYELDAGPEHHKYLWQDDSENQKFAINPETFERSGIYSVTVSDIHDCKASDDVTIDLQFRDIRINSMLLPDISCKLLSTEEPISVVVMNNGTKNINNTSIYMSYKLDGVAQQNQILQIKNVFYPLDTVIHTFSKTVDMSSQGLYKFDIIADVPTDPFPENNQLLKDKYVYPAPDLDLGGDTISKELPYLLDPGQYVSYLWQDGSTEQSYLATTNGTYSLTVTGNNGCPASDTVYISDAINIIEIVNEKYEILVYPNPAKDYIELTLKNPKKEKDFIVTLLDNSGKTLLNETFSFSGKIIKRINITPLPSGLYYLNVIIENEIHERIVIIQ